MPFPIERKYILETEEKSNHFYEILKGFPQSGEKIVSYGNQPFHSEGAIIRFFKSDKTTWIGNFNPGYTELTQIERLKKRSIGYRLWEWLYYRHRKGDDFSKYFISYRYFIMYP